MHPKYTQLRIGEKPPRVSLIERTCTICGSSFYVQPARIKHGRGQTCSRACQYKSVSAKALARHYPETSPRIDLTCPVCGDAFSMTRAKYEYRCTHDKVPTYCSIRCAHDSTEWKRNLGESLRISPRAKAARSRAMAAMIATVRSDEGRARKRANHQRQMADPEQRKRWEDGMRRRTQSPEWRAAKHFQKGAAHPRYTGYRNERAADRVRYAAKQWRKDVLRRDNYTCQACHVRGGRLHAHHIKPWATYPELRDDLANGITLCVGCHIAVHRGEVTLETHDHTPDT